LSPEQVQVIAQLEAAGAVVAVVRSVDEATAILQKWGLSPCVTLGVTGQPGVTALLSLGTCNVTRHGNAAVRGSRYL
jgi:hypothetical protein